MASAACSNEQKVPGTIEPLTEAGKPAQVQPGSVKGEVNFGTATVEVVDDANFFLVSGELPGSSQVTIKADADLGEGVVEISVVIDFEVSGAQATVLGVSFGTPVPK